MTELIRQLLVESLVLVAAGGALGLLVAFWSMDVLRVLLPDSLPRGSEIQVDGGVIAFALALSAAAGVLLGLCRPGGPPRSRSSTRGKLGRAV